VLPEGSRLQVGRLGTFTFPRGIYIYAGSALGPGGLRCRLRRHLQGPETGKFHWHIDYLSARAVDKDFAVVPTSKPLECALNRAVAELESSRIVAAGFGSSDCRCPGHLHRLEKKVWPAFPGLEPGPPGSNMP